MITLKDENDHYLANTHWRRNNLNQADSIDDFFRDFSKRVDNIIFHLKNDIIQIRTESQNAEGIFDFAINANTAALIESRIPLDATYDMFEQCVLDYLLERTTINLKAIQAMLLGTINTSFQSAIDVLETAVKRNSSKLNYRLSDEIVTARTEISKELSAIAQWFRFAQKDDYSDYTLRYAISTAYKLVRDSTREFYCDDTNVDDQIRLKGKSLHAMVYIMYNLLDNVKKHSGLTQTPHVTVSATRCDNLVHICVENEIRPGSIDKARMHSIISELNCWEANSKINTEGGTGLYKIRKLLAIDLSSETCTIDCDIRERVFSIIIEVGLGQMLI